MKIFLENKKIIEGYGNDCGSSVLKVRAIKQTANGSTDYVDHEIPREQIVRVEKTREDRDKSTTGFIVLTTAAALLCLTVAAL